MKQTAVEWLEDCFNRYGLVLKSDFIKAKEMEKQQIIESYCMGCSDITKNTDIFPRETSLEYYKETFNK